MLTYPMAVARSPWRPTAWRYQRGLELSTESRGAKLRSADDRPTRRTFLFLRAQSRAGNNEVALERLRNEYPEVSEAYTLFSDLETRPYVEARLLTREPLTRTAQRFEVSDAAIEFYENVFFNFRDRTKALDWLWKVVIVGHVPKVKELSARRVAMRGLLMRYVAWAGGEHALDGLFANGLTSAPADRKQVHRSTDSSTAVYIRCLEAELESFIDGKVLDAKTLIKASEQLSRLQQEAQSREDPELCRRVIKVYDDMMRAMSGNSWRK